MQHGEHIIGSGIDITTLHLARTNDGSTAIGSSYELVQGCELSDLTVDLSGTLDAHGVILSGGNDAIRRVRVINATSTAPGNELFLLSVGQAITLLKGECEVTNFTGGDCSAIAVFFGDYTHFGNNRVYLQNDATAHIIGSQVAFNAVDSRNVLIDGNYVNYATSGVYSDSGDNTNIIIANNTFANCDITLNLQKHPQQNVTFCFNTIISPNEPSQKFALYFDSQASPISYTNVLIARKHIQFLTPRNGSTFDLISANTIEGLTLVNNTIDGCYTMSNTNLAGCTAVNVYNNTDLFGAPIQLFNQTVPPNCVVRKSIFANFSATYADKHLGMKANGNRITLPSPVGHAGKEITIADETGSRTDRISIEPSSGTINGVTLIDYTFDPYAGITVISDGTNWFARSK